ncbi:uncharacterized protein LOC143279777 [Babylonia areolata]|uniref:uncharacterized protein LOC143279777 n=1 Tax=Babylonia areolata TaxID=304850 RepID=UPI003FCF6B49
MLTLKSSKHRCKCYSQQSGSFLYGLRRDAPSTERVLLERLLNILSRAAAHRGKNPQRLWAESERPHWWTGVTDLRWKNPREHPKDNKDTLKKKIEILEKELKKRGLMTKGLEEELEIHHGGKKTDLELKSDFEAIITKASGLHFMLDKVSSKMGRSPILSDKMATYISETKSCVDKIHVMISAMYQHVQAREEKKSDLWAQMGVSKHQRPVLTDDLQMDSFSIDSDLMPDLSSYCLNEDVGLSTSLGLQSMTSVTVSPESPELDISTYSPFTASSDGTLSPVPSSSQGLESSQRLEYGQDPSAKHQRSLSEPDSTSAELETGRLVLSAVPFVSKRSWSPSEPEDQEPEQTKAKSRRILPSQTVGSGAADVLVLSDEEEIDHLALTASVSGRGPRKDVKPPAESERMRVRLASKPRSPRSPISAFSAGEYKSLSLSMHQQVQHSTPVVSDRGVPPISSIPRRTEATASTSTSTHKAMAFTGDVLPADVVEDADPELCDVEAILEESATPTMSMYATNMETSVDKLADMTMALSCEDLHASVTERVMTGELAVPTSVGKRRRELAAGTTVEKQTRRPGSLSVEPKPVTGSTGVEHSRRFLVLREQGPEKQHRPLVAVGTGGVQHQHRFLHLPVRPSGVPSEEETEDTSLSRAIGSLSGDFFH